MSDSLDYNVRYCADDDDKKRKSKPYHVRVFFTRIDDLSTKFIEFQADLSEKFDDVLDEEPTKARLTEEINDESVRWSCVHETMEMLTLAVSALAAIKASVSEDTLQDYKSIVNCLDETASKQYSTLMLAETKDLWDDFYEKIRTKFSSLEAWANSNPKMYHGIKCATAAVGLFSIGGGLAALVAHFLPERVCAMGGPLFVISGLIALAIGACGLGIAYYMQQQKDKKDAFNGALLEMIQGLSKDMKGAPDLSEVLQLLRATREQATAKWGGLLSEEHKEELRPNLGTCSICLATLFTSEDLVVPVTGVDECRRQHVFHSHCLPGHGKCPLCRRNYLVVKHLQLQTVEGDG